MNIYEKDKLISAIQSYVINNMNSEIISLYLFGSYATGKATERSDIDIAVLLSESIERKDFLSIKLRVLADFSSCLGSERVDVVILNEATPELAYNVINEGTMLFEREKTRTQLVDFKARTFDRYFDYMPVKKMFSEALSRRIREGRYGG